MSRDAKADPRGPENNEKGEIEGSLLVGHTLFSPLTYPQNQNQMP